MIRKLLRLVCDHKGGTIRERDDATGAYFFVCDRCGYRERACETVAYLPLKTIEEWDATRGKQA